MSRRGLALFASLLLSLLSQLTALAQQRGERVLTVGVRGGYGQSNISFQPHQSREQRPSMEFGAAFRFTNLPHLGCSLELLYSRTGYQTTEFRERREGHPVPLGEPLECQDTWLRLPFLLHLQYTLGYLHAEALGGGYIDYLLSERVGAVGTPLVPQPIYFHTHNPFGAGLEAGGGIGLATRWGRFMIEYRTWYRLTNLYERPRIPKQDEPRSNPRNQTVGLAYYYILR
ncbi:MAG: outer membrane beta-barrel protein [Bacteroides sp.]